MTVVVPYTKSELEYGYEDKFTAVAQGMLDKPLPKVAAAFVNNFLQAPVGGGIVINKKLTVEN